MGEAWKRMRAAQFDHQNHRPYQALVDADLLRISRPAETRFEITMRLTNRATGLAVGNHCIVRDVDGEYDVLHGNMVVARLPPEAAEVVKRVAQEAPSLKGVFPCRVVRVGAFGAVSLALGRVDADES